MEPDKKSILVDEIGVFNDEETTWLEYHDRVEKCLMENRIYPYFQKKEVLLDAIGSKTLETLKTIIKPEEIEDIEYDIIIAKLEAHFYPFPDKEYYLTKFHVRRHKRNETFFKYVCALRKLMVNCEFGKSEHIELKNQLIHGCREDLKKSFCHTMSLSQLFEIGILWDESRTFKVIPHPRNYRARKDRTPKCFRCRQGIKEVHKEVSCPFEWAVCSSCGIKGHVSLACKYKDLICNTCEVRGHIAKICKKKGTPVTETVTESVTETVTETVTNIVITD